MVDVSSKSFPREEGNESSVYDEINRMQEENGNYVPEFFRL